MIVTVKQLAAMRSGKAKVLLVPARLCDDWTPGKRVQLRRLVERTEQRRTCAPIVEREPGDSSTAQTAITVTAIGGPRPLVNPDPRKGATEARQAGFRGLDELKQHWGRVFFARERRDLVRAVRFEVVADRPKLLAAGPRRSKLTGDYTRSRHRALPDEPEVMSPKT